ncbi:hypothetical protein Tco_0018813 [Tanacetum coccineum]
MSGQLAEMNNIVLKLQTNISDNPKTISKLEECVRKKDFENKHRKSKVVNFTMFQNLRAQVKELKIENDGLKLLVEEITMARERVEVTLRHRDEMVSAKCKKLQLLKEQSETFYEAPSEFDSDIFYDTQDNLEKVCMGCIKIAMDLVECLLIASRVKKTFKGTWYGLGDGHGSWSLCKVRQGHGYGNKRYHLASSIQRSRSLSLGCEDADFEQFGHWITPIVVISLETS